MSCSCIRHCGLPRLAAMLLHPCCPTLLRSPAIVGVSKRWRRVCWGSRRLWRRLIISSQELDAPSIASPAAQRPAAETPAARLARLHRRRDGWAEAKRAQLQKIGRLVEAVTVSDYIGWLPIPPSNLLSLLSPASLVHLHLRVLKFNLQQALRLSNFTRLTRLVIETRTGSWRGISPSLTYLTRLQHLELAGDTSGLEMADLQPLRGLTHLVSGDASGRAVFIHQHSPAAVNAD